MSRTKKSKKSSGYEYWSRPKTSKVLRVPSPWAKKEAIRRQRRTEKQKQDKIDT